MAFGYGFCFRYRPEALPEAEDGGQMLPEVAHVCFRKSFVGWERPDYRAVCTAIQSGTRYGADSLLFLLLNRMITQSIVI